MPLRLAAGLLGLTALLLPFTANAQQTPPQPSIVEAALLLRQLDGVKRVLVIGAHPDDEDTALLATLARGLGAQAAYLSLTRGEGGQNLIGPELGEGLGIVRTGELLAARRVDGASQLFTRAYDFGYSKTAEEAFRHWPRDSILADLVWAIRVFRPQIVVSVFEGMPTDGHGQHQVAGILAYEALEAAGDPARFRDQALEGAGPWRPYKLYRRTWRDPASSTLAVETGRLDPVLGRSYHQVAMRSRSQHRSQDFGTREPGGPRVTLLKLVDSRVPGPDTSLFAGIDTTLAGLALDLTGDAQARAGTAIGTYRSELHSAMRALVVLQPRGAVPTLARALEALREARAAAGPSGRGGRLLRQALENRLRGLQEVILATASVTLIAEAEDDIVVPGDQFSARAKLWNGGPFSVEPSEPEILSPAGWQVTPDPAAAREPGSRFYPRSLEDAITPSPDSAAENGPANGGAADEGFADEGPADEAPQAGEDATGPLGPGQTRSWGLGLRLLERAALTQPYYLEAARAGDLYRWPDDGSLRGRPFGPPPFSATVRLRLLLEDPVEIAVARPFRYRGVDKAVGEFWRPVLVLPQVSVALEPRSLVWPLSEAGSRPITVTVRNEARDGFSGRLRLALPDGWTAMPAEHRVDLHAPGSLRAFEFMIGPGQTLPADMPDSALTIGAVVQASHGREFAQEVVLVDHPHIEPTPYLRPASATLRAVDLQVDAGRRVGYLAGSGDQVPEAIRQLGLSLETIGPEELEANGLDAFDVIVLGVRAYEVRPDLAAANQTLLDWVSRGGTLIVQYNKYELPEGGYAPYPVEMGRPHGRVTDEASQVVLLDPESPLLTYPNRITLRDFDGWEQERGLYFMSEWDERYAPLLAVSDAGEEPQEGALLVARVGDGLWVYTGLSLFRQLPAGVPGAYRLFANLLSLRPEDWPAVGEPAEAGSAARARSALGARSVAGARSATGG